VADFPKVDGSFSQSRSLIFPKSVAHFLKDGTKFYPLAFLHNKAGFRHFRGEVMLLTSETAFIMILPP